MSKSHIEALINTEYEVLKAKDNKERLKFMVAGIKDGCFYNHANGAIYGEFDTEVPDTVFISEADLEMFRVTSTKIVGITLAMQQFFVDYNGADEPTVEDEPTEPTVEEEAIDTEAVEKACKKAIKKGDFKKAQKLIDKLGGHKKLQKKLDKAQ